MPNLSEIEILAPAGSYESLHAAINAGCDAIYFGVTQLNMRAVAASNFDLDDLAEITKICHENNIKAYLTVNTILYEQDLTLIKKIIDAAKANQVDAIIVSDFAAIEYAKKIGQAMQISTMQSISNYEAVKFFSQYADVIVLAREVTIPMMKRIHEKIVKENLCGPSGKLIKLEVFAHGALCIAVSGRCLMSQHNHNASATRGACRQECRKEYRITDEESGIEMKLQNNFVMSPSDLCTIEILDQLLEAGAAVLKFEGRGRPPEYVDTVISCYKEALEALKDNTYTPEKIKVWQGRLKKVYNRNFSTGFYMGQKLGFLAKGGHNQAKEKRIYAGKVTHYYPQPQVAEIKLEAASLKLEDKIIFTGQTTGLVRAEVTEMRSDDKQEITEGQKKTIVSIKCPQLVRHGDKVYILHKRKSGEKK